MDKTATLLAMLRNEGDIVPLWLSHVLTLFDRVIIIDNCSLDGTREYLESRCDDGGQLQLLHFPDRVYIQAELMNHLLWDDELGALSGDFVFFLDGDEFLPFESHDSFKEFLSSAPEDGPFSLRWRNCLPKIEREELLREDYLISTRASKFEKVASCSKWLREVSAKVIQGNHGFITPDGGIVETQELGEIHHFPLRSRNQALTKLRIGIGAYDNLGRNRVSEEGSHLEHLFDSFTQGSLSWLDLGIAAAFYGEFGFPTPNSLDEIFEEKSWTMACSREIPPIERKNDHLIELMLEDYRSPSPSKLASAMRPLTVQSFDGTVSLGKKSIVDSFWCRNETEESLSPSYSREKWKSHLKSSFEFIAPAFWNFQVDCISAWYGHVPVMNCFLPIIAPSTFVELGSHYGNSFFAILNGAKRHGKELFGVAIDTWTGDENSGYYDEGVWNFFSKKLKESYSDRACALRMDFSQALNCFPESSIDLLHIDGHHRYASVAEDFEAYLPKLSQRAVLLFHDINEYEKGFEVWKLWKELKDRYPSLEFCHGHGLGMLAVGRDCEDFRLCCDILNEDESLYCWLQSLFQSLATFYDTRIHDRRFWNQSKEIEIEKLQKQRAAEIEELKRRVEDLSFDFKNVTSSRSWKITAPLRALMDYLRGT